jgi:RNA polymerase sigma factor (sigma-70 family)
MRAGLDRIADWIGQYVLPHESAVRAWLLRTGVPPDQVEDIIQEGYCRIAALDSVSHIRSGRAYFFEIARNLATERFRRNGLISITDENMQTMSSDEPSPEQVVVARQELRRVLALIANLPSPCREIITLRRILGQSQRATAARLGITEGVVEAQTIRGTNLLMAALRDEREPSVDTNRAHFSSRARYNNRKDDASR